MSFEDVPYFSYARSFLKATLFFNSASVLLNFFMNCALNVLLSTYKHYHNEALFVFTLFVSISKPKSIYIVSM